VSGGSVTSITVTSGGTGYTTAPQVLIDPPSLVSESNDVLSYNGDSGIIVGFGTTVADYLTFDLHIPLDSYFRNTDIVGTAVTVSQINAGDYFIVDGSNIGFAQTTITSKGRDNTNVAVGKSFYDNVYQVNTATTVYNTGISSHVRRVSVKVSGASTALFANYNNVGDYSWGRIELQGRSELNSYPFYGNGGIIGITTSGLVTRTTKLESDKYVAS